MRGLGAWDTALLTIGSVLGTGIFLVSSDIAKALPHGGLLLLVWLGKYMSPEARAKYAVEEPLDGILIGAAAGGGFAIIETLAQYVPQMLSALFLKVGAALSHIPATALQNLTPEEIFELIKRGSNYLGTDYGVLPLIIRSIDLSFGHMAYSGYFGYFIGLSVLKPQQRWKILGIGLVSASIPHALWDTVAGMNTAPLLALCALLSYAVLAAAVLKAREISPNRAILQPSVIFGASQTVPPAAAAPAGPPIAPAAVATAASVS